MSPVEAFTRANLSSWPTPIEPLTRLSKHLGGPEIFLKHDDMGSLALGGNKLRKLEFLLGDAVRSGCDTVITSGAIQSNHARLTAAASAKLGLKCHLLLKDEVTGRGDNYYHSSNILLDGLLGAEVEIVGREDDLQSAVTARHSAFLASGQRPYTIPLGGSNALGSLGYVVCAAEIADKQAEMNSPFSHIVVVSGSGGTHAGLDVGCHYAGLRAKVMGVTISRSADEQKPIVMAFVQQIAALLGMEGEDWEDRITLDDSTYLPGYGHPNAQTLDAISLCAKLEGILLDPVYTGKAMAALIAQIRAGKFSKTDQILFIHTGGSPALFAYDEMRQIKGAKDG